MAVGPVARALGWGALVVLVAVDLLSATEFQTMNATNFQVKTVKVVVIAQVTHQCPAYELGVVQVLLTSFDGSIFCLAGLEPISGLFGLIGASLQSSDLLDLLIEAASQDIVRCCQLESKALQCVSKYGKESRLN